MLKYLSFIKGIYDRLMAAPDAARSRVMTRLREARDTGVMPIGLEKTVGGTDRLLWLVFDPTKFASAAALDVHLRARTPAGLDFATIVLRKAGK